MAQYSLSLITWLRKPSKKLNMFCTPMSVRVAVASTMVAVSITGLKWSRCISLKLVSALVTLHLVCGPMKKVKPRCPVSMVQVIWLQFRTAICSVLLYLVRSVVPMLLSLQPKETLLNWMLSLSPQSVIAFSRQ